jgi:protein TonB
MRTNNLSLVALGVSLIVAVGISYLIARPLSFVKESRMPVFMAQPITVQKAAPIVSEAGTDAVAGEIKVVSFPAPQPTAVTPLPIFPPRVIYSVLPVYPAGALQKAQSGTVLLSLYINSSGNAERVEVKNSSGVAELDRSAVAAISKWKFDAATQGGAVVASWFEVPVRFQIN